MAKFKKGDRVVATEPNYHTRGIGVVRGYEYSWDEEIERDDPGWYIVDFPNQYKVKMGKGSLRAANAARSRNAYAVDKKGRPIKSGMMLKDDDGDKFYVGRVLRGNVVEDEWGNQRLETNRWAEIVQNSIRSRNAVVQKALNATATNGAMAALDSSEKSKIKSIASGIPCSFMDGGDSLSGVIKHSKRPFLYIDFDVSKSEIDGKPYYEWYVHAWNRTRKWERNGGQYKIEDAVSAAAQAMRGAKQMIEKWAGGVPLNADTSVIRETAVNATERMLPVYSSAGKAFMKKAEAEYARTNFRGSSDFRSLWARLTGELDRIDAIPDDEKDDIEENLHLLAGQVPYRTTNAVVAKALNAQAVCNAGDPGHFTSDELSALKGAFAGLNGASFSQYPNKSREQLAVRGENGILITVQKYAFDGEPVKFDIRGQGPRSGFGVKFASSIREAVTTVKRMLASAKRQSPYSFSKYD